MKKHTRSGSACSFFPALFMIFFFCGVRILASGSPFMMAHVGGK
jgi:hypothetical protein